MQESDDKRGVLRVCLEDPERPHLQAVCCKIARPLAVRGLQRKVPDEFVLAVALEQSMQNKEGWHCALQHLLGHCGRIIAQSIDDEMTASSSFDTAGCWRQEH